MVRYEFWHMVLIFLSFPLQEPDPSSSVTVLLGGAGGIQRTLTQTRPFLAYYYSLKVRIGDVVERLSVAGRVE
jgi:hypothetical protein